MYTHLHTHSYYSFLDGIFSPKQLVKAAENHGMSTLALTDHNGLTGAVEFYDKCIEVGIKPILGLELTVQHPLGAGNLLLLGMDINGWSNLCRLSSQVKCKDTHDPHQVITIEQLESLSKKLICLSGGKRSLAFHLLAMGQASDAEIYLGQLKDIFNDRLYIEMQYQEPSDVNVIRQLNNIGSRNDWPLVATNNVHYKTADQEHQQRTLSAIRTNTKLSSLSDDLAAPRGCTFTSSEEMIKRFEELPDAIKNTQVITSRCNLDLPVGIPHYPNFSLDKGETALGRLRKLAESGAVHRYGKITTRIAERLNHELNVINENGYAPIFLIVQAILDHARKIGVPLSSRGSAASSLVAYCLGITTPDPLALNLYFERFLNPARSSPPDIDTDLCSKRRDKVIQHVYEQFGENRVAMVATINRFQPRSALREVAKAYGLSSTEINQLTSSLLSRGWSPSDRLRSQSLNPYETIKSRYPQPKYQAIFHDASAILGTPRHLSIHPGGIVITPGPVTDLVPTQLANKGIVTTQFDLGSVERMGLIKIDLLGTRGLTVLGDVAEKIHKWNPTEYSGSLEVLDSIPKTDTEGTSLLQSTNTIGCFAIESPGMRSTLREINAKTPEDIMIALALYRPGPITGGLKDKFIRRHLGLEPIEHIHPSLAEILENTYGVILYQEQVLRIASDLAGLSLADADLLRRAMSHFDPGDQMKTLKERFIEGALVKSGVTKEIGEHIWDLMAAFAGYGFPKAHAASYAQVAWRSVWCKAHYPAEFMAAVLAGWGGYYRQYVYIHETRRLGLAVRPPHINHSSSQFSATYPNGVPVLFMGLDQVHSLTRVTQKRIQDSKPFLSLDDFLTRVDPSLSEAENLIKVGALRGFGSIPNLLKRIKFGGWRFGQPRLFDLSVKENDTDDWDLPRRMKAQQKILGIGMDAHPVEMVKDELSKLGVIDISQSKRMINEEVKVAGIRLTTHRYFSAGKSTYYILELDDPTGLLTVRLSEPLYRRYRGQFSSIKPMLFEGVLITDSITNMVVLDAKRVEPIFTQ